MNDANGHDPVAIIGLGCRFPGEVDSPASFWDLLIQGRDAIGELPDDRWQHYAVSPEYSAALRRTTRYGGFLGDVRGFDADFFGISPREAELMDPQQRMTLEVVWEALEHAGLAPDRLAGGDAGVFVGVNTDDHARRTLEDLPRIEAWTGIGASLCAVANRVSYHLDLRGPSMVVDTACSSSLTAVHLACQSLLAGETPLAIAGGVMAMVGPGLTMVMDAADALSADGRSKSFDASADGYGRGEGCGIVVMKRLSAAHAAGDRVLALIRGTAVCQDGRTNGIMAPSREAQEHMLRRVYRAAAIHPSEIDYVEAHGTGTRVGDPIEAGAMGPVFRPGRAEDRPLLIGSVKSNIGHLEAASGVAGLIKTVLALRHGELPPSLHCSTPNPAIDWDGLRVVTERTPWPAGERPRRAGVSSYGYGGTIAHLIVEEPPVRPADEQPVAGEPLLVPLSGTSERGVRDLAERLADHVAATDVPLRDVAHTLALHRSHLAHRAVVTATGRDELASRLRGLAAGEPTACVTSGRVLAAGKGPVWVFSGHGSQWPRMGHDLLADPRFSEVIAEIEPIFRRELGFSPGDALRNGDLGGTDQIQPLIFATQVGVASMLIDRGLRRPSAIIGHSVGEISAATVAGMLTLKEAALLICRRSRLLRRAVGKGAMAMVGLPFEQAADRLRGRADVVPAIDASPGSTIVAGAPEAVAALSEQWRQEGLVVRRVDSDVAFHGPQMDPLAAELARALDDLNPAPPEIPVYSTALDDARSRAGRDGSYWAANLRNPVRLRAAVQAALDDGHRIFVEVSPHPVVLHSVGETVREAGLDNEVCLAHTLRRGRSARSMLDAALATLHCHGVPVEWGRATPGGELVELPPRPWRRRERAEVPPPVSGLRRHDDTGHTLLGGLFHVHGSSRTRMWQTYLDTESRPYPGDHPVHGVEIVPAAVLLNTFFAAAGGDRPAVLTDIDLRVPVAVSPPRELQVVSQDGELRLSTRVPDGGDDGEGWLSHTTGVVSPQDAAEWLAGRSLNLAKLADHCVETLAPSFVIDRLASIGVAAMGFPWEVVELSRGVGELYAGVAVAPGAEGGPQTWAPVLDAALSIASVVFPGPPALRMPAHIRKVAVTGPPPAEVLIDVRIRDTGGPPDTVHVDIATLEGQVVARLHGLRYGMLEGHVGLPASPARLVHELSWHPVELPAGDVRKTVVVLGELALDGSEATVLTARGPEDLDALRGRLRAGDAVIVAPPAGHAGPAAQAWRLARVAQHMAAWEQRDRLSLWCVTRGVREAVDETALAQSPLWGLGRIIAGEHPDLWGGLVDLPAAPSVADQAVLRVIAAAPGEDVVALRPEGAFVARLTPVERPPELPPFACRPDGTYLITGGLGVLGLEVAQWLAGHGARRLVLAGRRPMPPRERWEEVADPGLRRWIEAIRGLEAAGVTVRTVALDIADREEAARLLSPSALGLPPVRGVVHAAGVLDNRLLHAVEEDSLRAVMRPKVDGALTLHELYPPGSLDFLVLFSSCGVLLNLPGQATYGAANAFLDALAAHRGDGTVSFGWTSWRGLGMSTSSALIDSELEARGAGDMSATEAFRGWEYAARYRSPYFAVLRPVPLPPGFAPPPLMSGLTADEPAAHRSDPAELPWADLTGEELRGVLTEEVSAIVAAELRLDSGELDVRRPLAEMGLDSIMTLGIRRRLERRFRVRLPATLLWNRPTVQAVGLHLTELLAQQDGGS